MLDSNLQSLEDARRERAQRELKNLRQNWEPPLPLVPDAPPAKPFPSEALSPGIQNVIKAIHEKTQAPMALGAQSVLAALTLAVQSMANVRLPTGQDRPLSNFFVTIAGTGERKTSADGEALVGVRRYEQRLREQFDDQFPSQKNKLDAFERQRDQILRDKRSYPGWEEKSAALDALGPKPTLPPLPILLGSKPTTQGIERLMLVGQPSFGIFSSEGGEFFGGYAMSRENKLATIAWLSSGWDGADMTRIVAGEVASIIRGRRISMHLMAQPLVVEQFLSDELVSDQGLLSRMLVTMPESTIGTRFWREAPDWAVRAIEVFGTRIFELLQIPMPLTPGKQNELSPPHLALSPLATEEWIAFHNGIEDQVGSEGPLDPVRGLAIKSPEIAARLAGSLALYEDPECREIAPAHLVPAIKVIEYYLAEALRLFGRAPKDPNIRRAMKLWRFLQSKGYESFCLADILQFGPSELRQRDIAAAALNVLERHHYVRSVPGGMKVHEKHRKEAWLVWRE